MKRVPHIALVHDNFMGPTGMGRIMERLAHYVLDYGWALTIVGSRVPSSLHSQCVVHEVPGWWQMPAVPQHLAWATGAARAIRRLSVDLVHVQSPLLAPFADLMTCHFAARPAFARGVREHSTGPEGVLRRAQERLERRIDDIAYRHRPESVYVSFVSEFLRDEFVTHYGDPRGGWITPPPAPPWHPVSDEERRAARARWGISNGRIVAGYLGGDNPRKGLPFLRSLTSESDLELLLAGPGSERLTWNSRDGLGVVDPGDLYAACDVVVAPSIFDSAPVAILEALARGVPVVVSNSTGWAGAVARRRAGVVWEPGMSLAESVREAATMPVDACRAVTDDFSDSRQRELMRDVYCEVLERTD